jgi:hypothetical protein
MTPAQLMRRYRRKKRDEQSAYGVPSARRCSPNRQPAPPLNSVLPLWRDLFQQGV